MEHPEDKIINNHQFVFIGRVREQREFRTALKGVWDDSRRWGEIALEAGDDFEPDTVPPDLDYARVFIIHGIGGIGKSRLIQQCLEMAETEFSDCVPVIIKEDLSHGINPVESPTRLMERIARRLNDAGYSEFITPYHQACDNFEIVKSKVTRYQEANRERWDGFVQQAAALAARGVQLYANANGAMLGERSYNLTKTVIAETVHTGAAELAKAYDLLIEQMQQDKKLSGQEAELFLDPLTAQAHALVDGMQRLATQQPLVIALDTLEVIVSLEPFLQEALIVPASNAPILWILAGRHNLSDERQVEIENEMVLHKGYHDRLPQENPPVVWDLSVFGDADLRDYLQNRLAGNEKLLKNDKEWVEKIKRISSGVPLAVEMVVDAIRQLGPETFLQQFPLPDTLILPDEQLTLIIQRFLRYCLGQHPEDLGKIQALALLRPSFDDRALRYIWALPEDEKANDILAHLRARYSLFRGRRLHDAVYEFLRRELRTSKECTEIRQRLGKRAVEYYFEGWKRESDLPKDIDPALRIREPRWQAITRDLLNAYLWADPDAAITFLLPCLTEGLGFDRDFAIGLLDQVEEFLIELNALPIRRIDADRLRCIKAGLVKLANYRGSFDSGVDLGPTVENMLTLLQKIGTPEALHRTILHLWQGRFALLQKHHPDALESYEKALQECPPLSVDLRQQIGIDFLILGIEFILPTLNMDVIPSPQGLHAIEKAIKLLPEKASAWYYQGVIYTKMKHYEQAEVSYLKAIELDPQDASPWNGLGNLLQEHLERYEEAEPAYRKAIEIDPQNATPWNNLGNLLGKHLERYEEAAAVYHKAIELDPQDAGPWNGLGNLLGNHLERYEEAEAAYLKAIELDPQIAGVWCNLGNLLGNHLKRYEEAEAAYHKAIELDPQYINSWNGLGNLLGNHLERYEEAALAYYKAIELDPQNAIPWNGLGNLLGNHLERYEEAEAAYHKAIELDPQYANPWNGLGNLLGNHLKRHEEAEVAYHKAIELDPQYAKSWNGLGNLLGNYLERYEEAEAAYRKAIEIDPQVAGVWYNLGNLLRNHPECYEEAKVAYHKAIELDPQYANPWNGLGNLLGNYLERYEEAEAAYRKAIELDSQYAIPWYNLGNLLQDHCERYKEAEVAYRKAIELNPQDAGVWNNLGNLLQDHLGCYEEAQVVYRKAIELNPQDAGVWNNLGNLLQDHLGCYEEAQVAYRKAIELNPQDAGVWNNLGNLLQDHLGCYEEADVAYHKAMELDSQLAGVWNNLGNLLGNHFERYEEAEAAYRKAIEIDPHDSTLWHNLGNLLGNHFERYEEAEAAYRKAIEIDPHDSTLWNNLGDLLQEYLERYKEAEIAYCKAIEIDPQLAAAWNNFGNLLQGHLERYEEAEAAYRKAIEIDPHDVTPWNNLGNLLQYHLKHYEEAEVAYRKTIELDPQDAISWYNLANVLQFHQKRYDEAEKAYQKAIELDPQEAFFYSNLSSLLFKLKRTEEAALYLEKARELIPEEDFYNRACLEATAENTEDALSFLSCALEKQPELRSWAARDPDLEPLHDNPRFIALVGENPDDQ